MTEFCIVLKSKNAKSKKILSVLFEPVSQNLFCRLTVPFCVDGHFYGSLCSEFTMITYTIHSNTNNNFNLKRTSPIKKWGGWAKNTALRSVLKIYAGKTSALALSDPSQRLYTSVWCIPHVV